MKQFILFVSLTLITGLVHAQEKLGIASYSVPAGWQQQKLGNGIALFTAMSKGQQLCRITISGTEQIIVNSQEHYLKLRDNKNTSNVVYGTGQRQVIRKEANGYTSFMSAGTQETNGKKMHYYFYSFTNNQESFFIELQAESKSCVEVFNRFLANLEIDEPVTEDGQKNKAPVRRGKKAAPAAPAAPAPMM